MTPVDPRSTGAPNRRGRLFSLCRVEWIPPALLFLVALLQLITTSTTHFVPWKGGGFGMFATFDRGPLRIIRGRGRPAGSADWLPLDLRPQRSQLGGISAADWESITAAPTPRALRRLASHALELSWSLRPASDANGHGRSLVVDVGLAPGDTRLQSVEVWVEGAEFIAASNRLRYRILGASVRCSVNC